MRGDFRRALIACYLSCTRADSNRLDANIWSLMDASSLPGDRFRLVPAGHSRPFEKFEAALGESVFTFWLDFEVHDDASFPAREASVAVASRGLIGSYAIAVLKDTEQAVFIGIRIESVTLSPLMARASNARPGAFNEFLSEP
jgi:hypothetical protein